VSDEEAVLMHGYMDEINKLTKNNSKYLSGGGTNVEMDGVQACAYALIRYTAGDDSPYLWVAIPLNFLHEQLANH